MSDTGVSRPDFPEPLHTDPEPVTATVVIAAPRVDDPAGAEPDEDADQPPRGLIGRLRHGLVRFWGMPTEGWVSLFVVLICVAFTFAQLGPGNIFANTTPNGGDMGAHVWGPAYLRDHLLTHGRLTGWTPDWYAGFPAYQFYMVVPSLAIALLSYVIPYGVAFKLVAISGVLSLPVCAWAFGRLTRLPFPIPPLLAVGATAFLFDRSFSILGGNIASTLAGEFAFSISLSLAVLYLGVLGRGLETGRHRGWAALLLALTGLCHLIPAFFAIGGTLAWFILRPGVARLRYLATTLPVAGALAAFWVLPFYMRSRYMNDMGWEKKKDFFNFLFERTQLDSQLVNSPPILWVLGIAAVGAVMALILRRRGSLFWLLMAELSALAFWLVPQSRLWNARLLPFYYLSLYLLAAIGVGEVFKVVSILVARDRSKPVRSVCVSGAVVGLVVTLVTLALPLHALPNNIGPIRLDGMEGTRAYRWLWFETTDDSFVDAWANWNFTGYESRPAYPEYFGIVQTMGRLGDERGCGRAMWEHEEQHDRYGTPMALMLLPFWTDGCIGSMEGLYFEASSTTPYHFLNQDELSSAPSNAQRDLPYSAGAPSRAEFDLGIEHLQMLGVRYYMAISDRMIDFASRNPDLTQVATSGPWVVFEVADSYLVEPLANEPAVVRDVSDHKAWLAMSVEWYMNRGSWQVRLTDEGPTEWQRISRGEIPDTRPQPEVEVTNIVSSDDSISFDVSETGVPVVVKASYFPNWKATGARGPWRATPNLMVVVPTSNHVTLTYGYTSVDVGSYAISALGLVGLVWLFRATPIVMPEPAFPRRRTRRGLDDGDDASGDPDPDADPDDADAVPGDEGVGGGGAVAGDRRRDADPDISDDPEGGRTTGAYGRPDPSALPVDPLEAILGPVADLVGYAKPEDGDPRSDDTRDGDLGACGDEPEGER